MTNSASLCQTLQTLWHTDFPLSKAMDMRPVSFEDHVLTTRTSLAPNTNTHGTAFAGSLYAIEALTAWGLLYLELLDAGFDASIIHANGNIEFAHPVKEDILAQASFVGHDGIFETLRNTGKARLTLTTQVSAAGKVASQFSGLYVVRLN